MGLPTVFARFLPRRTAGPAARLFPGVPVTALETRGLRDEGVLVVDVREPREWASGHIEGSRNIPLDVIGPDLLPPGIPVVLVCRSVGDERRVLEPAPDLRLERGDTLIVVGLADRLDTFEKDARE